MNGLLRRLAAVLVLLSAFASSATGGAAGYDIPVLMYHDITDDPAALNTMRVTSERFRWDMEFLAQFGYTPLLPAELLAIRAGEKEMPEKSVMITFDDGYRSNYELAFPVLRETGMKAVVAVVCRNMLERGSGDPGRTALTWRELREMAASGVFEIGSHTYDLHNPEYQGKAVPGGINGVMRRPGETESTYAARVGADLAASIAMIRRKTGQQSVNYFSYPFGAAERWMQPLLQQEGIGVSTLTNEGAASIDRGLYDLPRYRVDMSRPLSVLLRQTATAEPSQTVVSSGGKTQVLPTYLIDGSHYVRVRDVAALLDGTEVGFDVRWNATRQCVELTSKTDYTTADAAAAPLPTGGRTVQSVVEPTVVDGTARMVAAYKIDGSTYYKLRSLGVLCGFAVDWDEQAHAVLLDTAPQAAQVPA